MKKKLGMILLAATLFGTIATSSASAGPICYPVKGGSDICEY